MYFEGLEENQTKLWIINALLEQLERKDYSSITINMIVERAKLGRRTFYRYFKTKDEVIEYITELLMDQFAKTIQKNGSSCQEEVALAYFEFWENYIDVLLLLKKAHLLYFIEDHLTELIANVAKKIKHIPPEMSQEEIAAAYEQYKYAFAIKLAGFWKATILWCEETPRKSPKEMSKIITSLLT